MSRDPQSLRQVSVNCPRGLDQIVNRCLQKDRGDRYQSAAELLIDLENTHKVVSLPPRFHSYFNVRTAALAAVVLLICVVATFIYTTWTNAGHTLAVTPITCEGVAANQCLGPTVT